MGIPDIRKYMDKKNRLRFMYAKHRAGEPVDEKVILFESFHGKEISDTPLAMARALLAMPADTQLPNGLKVSDLKLYFSTNDLDRDKKAIEDLGYEECINLIHIHSDEYTRLLATAGLLINNSSFPSYIVRREGQKYLQTWHGTPLKTLGKSMRLGIESMYNVQHNFLQASYILQPNDFTRDVIMRDYFLDDLYTGKGVMCG